MSGRNPLGKILELRKCVYRSHTGGIEAEFGGSTRYHFSKESLGGHRLNYRARAGSALRARGLENLLYCRYSVVRKTSVSSSNSGAGVGTRCSRSMAMIPSAGPIPMVSVPHLQP